jgi:CheY-like chemotaxis protein
MNVRRVLIVDDQLDVRRMLGASLKTLGEEFDVLEVPSGEEALLIGTTLQLDLLVSDVRLPGMSGLDLIAKIRKRSPDLKVILITGASDSKTRRQVADAGADAFFYKPLEIADFLDTVERCLGMVKEVFPLPPVAEEPIAQAVRPAPVVEEPAPLTLADRLSSLRKELDAISAVLLDDTGHVLAEAGEFLEIHADEALVSAIMATFSASLKVSHSLGMHEPDNMLFFAGVRHHLCLVPVSSSCVLVLVARDGFQVGQLTAMSQAVRPAVHDLQSILENTGMQLQPQREEPIPAPPPLAEVVIDPEVLAGVDALFGQVSSDHFKQQDADAFWDTLAEQSELNGGSNADALNYEQAKRLGLAPEDE